jgi:hypothetical protein
LKVKSIAVLGSLAAIVTVVIFGVNNSLASDTQPTPFAPEELISKSKELPEVQAFLTKYPNATALVDQSSDIVVQHTISKSKLEGHPIDASNITAARKDSYLYMQVFMGSTSLRVQQVSLLCDGGAVIYDKNDTGWTRGKHFQINEGIIGYLEHGWEKKCFT